MHDDAAHSIRPTFWAESNGPVTPSKCPNAKEVAYSHNSRATRVMSRNTGDLCYALEAQNLRQSWSTTMLLNDTRVFAKEHLGCLTSSRLRPTSTDCGWFRWKPCCVLSILVSSSQLWLVLDLHMWELIWLLPSCIILHLIREHTPVLLDRICKISLTKSNRT